MCCHTMTYHHRSEVAASIDGETSEVLRSLIAEQRIGVPGSRFGH